MSDEAKYGNGVHGAVVVAAHANTLPPQLALGADIVGDGEMRADHGTLILAVAADVSLAAAAVDPADTDALVRIGSRFCGRPTSG